MAAAIAAIIVSNMFVQSKLLVEWCGERCEIQVVSLRTINSNVVSYDCPHHTPRNVPYLFLLLSDHKNSMLHYFIVNLHAEYIFMKA